MAVEETGMDPEVKKYFRKIMNSFGLGLFWMLATFTAGLYFKLALFEESIRWYNAVFYLLFVVSFAWLLWYLYKIWKA